jgi:hypothetical protein
VFELVVAVLAGLGLEILLRRWREQVVRIAFTATTVVMALVLAELWRKVATARLLPTQLPSSTTPSVATLESLRRSSLIWPTATIVAVVLLVVASWVFRRSSPERPWARRASSLAALVLLGAQSAFLLFAGVGINSYSHDANPVTPQVATLTSIVGSKLVGLDGGNTNCAASSPHNQIFCGVRLWRGVGFYPEMNISYGVDELGLHDPTIPQAYFDAWPVPNAEQVTPVNLNLFAPDVDTVALARRYGVAYVLAAPGEPAPKGMQLEAMISGEALYFVPGSERFSFVGAASTGSGPGRVSAHVISSSHPSDAKYVVDVSAPRMSKLAVRITDVTGWHAVTNTGKTLTLLRYEGGLLSVEVPAGTRTVTLTYWPRRFTEGIIVAVLALAILIGWAVAYPVGSRWRRKRAPKVVAGLPAS